MFQSNRLSHSREKAKTITLKTSINKLLSQYTEDKEEHVCLHNKPNFAYKQTYLSQETHIHMCIVFVYICESEVQL